MQGADLIRHTPRLLRRNGGVALRSVQPTHSFSASLEATTFNSRMVGLVAMRFAVMPHARAGICLCKSAFRRMG